MSGRGGSKIAVILLDESGTIVDAHESCTETFGWRRDELLGKDIRELLQYGRDLLLNQLHSLGESESAENTSFTVRVLAKRKDQQQFPARATVRRFQELECWTVAFYKAEAVEQIDSNVSPSVSAEEIALAKRALEGTGTRDSAPKKQTVQERKSMSVSRLWRNSRLLFSARDEKTNTTEETAPNEINVEQRIAEDANALVAQCAQAIVPGESAPALAPIPNVQKADEKVAVRSQSVTVMAPPEPIQPKVEPQSAQAPHVTHSTQMVQGTSSAENVVVLARLKAELEKERGERTRIEQRAASLSSQVQTLHLQLSEGLNLERENQSRVATLEQELRSAQDELTQAKAGLQNERTERMAAEDQLNVLRELNRRLDENLASFEKARRNFESIQTQLEARLEQSQGSLKQAELALESERDSKHRVEQSLSVALREHRASEQRNSTEMNRLQSALASAEIETKRGQEQALRCRAETLDAARESRARVQKFQNSFSHVLQHINGTTRELLQSPLSDEQKYVIEALLQEIISLESTLDKEPEPLAPNSGNVSVPEELAAPVAA